MSSSTANDDDTPNNNTNNNTNRKSTSSSSAVAAGGNDPDDPDDIETIAADYARPNISAIKTYTDLLREQRANNHLQSTLASAFRDCGVNLTDAQRAREEEEVKDRLRREREERLRAEREAARLYDALNNKEWDVAWSILESDDGFQQSRHEHEFRWTPLHIACATGCPLPLLLALIAKNPDAAKTKEKLMLRFPLHIYLNAFMLKHERHDMVPTVRTLIDSNPDAVSVQDADGCTPLDTACRVMAIFYEKYFDEPIGSIPCWFDDTTPVIVETLVRSDIRQMPVADYKGRTPLQQVYRILLKFETMYEIVYGNENFRNRSGVDTPWSCAVTLNTMALLLQARAHGTLERRNDVKEEATSMSSSLPVHDSLKVMEVPLNYTWLLLRNKPHLFRIPDSGGNYIVHLAALAKPPPPPSPSPGYEEEAHLRCAHCQRLPVRYPRVYQKFADRLSWCWDCAVSDVKEIWNYDPDEHDDCNVDCPLIEIINQTLTHCPITASIPSATGRLPLHLAVASGKTWDPIVSTLFEAEPKALSTRDTETHMLPFMLAAVYRKKPPKKERIHKVGMNGKPLPPDPLEGVLWDLCTVFDLLMQDPSLVQGGNVVPAVSE